MKVEFEKEYLQELYEHGKTSDKHHRYQPQVVNNYLKCVKYLIKATRIEDLFLINSLNYKRLEGDKKGLSAVRINDKYRLEFHEKIDSNDTFRIEICSLVDITNHYKKK